jgi:hypothetical protein
MKWLNDFAPALQAIAAVASLLVTAVLAWLAWLNVKLTQRLSEVSTNQAELTAKQLDLAVATALDLRQRKAAALQELCRRIRVTTGHLDPNLPNGPISKKFAYLNESDVTVLSALAPEVSVEAAKNAALIALALRQVHEQVLLAQTDPHWQPTLQQKADWRGSLDTIRTDVPKLEQDCTKVLLQKP